jgi:DNA-binding transcriptional ArsR family regulator
MVNYDESKLFQAISDPTRRSIIEQIVNTDKRISDLCTNKDMSLAGISKHIKVLEESGLITKKKKGREHLISLSTPGLLIIDKWVSKIKNDLVNQLLSKK